MLLTPTLHLKLDKWKYRIVVIRDLIDKRSLNLLLDMYAYENGFHDLDGSLAESRHVEGEASSLRQGFDQLGPRVEAK